MSNRVLGSAFLAFVIGALGLSAWDTISACAPIMPTGKAVEMATESALIVWDEKAKTEHFVRRASFQTEVPSFGFLVPRPARPEQAGAAYGLSWHNIARRPRLLGLSVRRMAERG
jgi:hypothetical protein